jgi:hypothetical protein
VLTRTRDGWYKTGCFFEWCSSDHGCHCSSDPSPLATEQPRVTAAVENDSYNTHYFLVLTPPSKYRLINYRID